MTLRNSLCGALAACAVLSACSKDSVIYYGDVAMGHVVAGSVVTDTGLTYDVVEQTCEGDLSRMDRVMTVCDILRKTAENRFDVRLTRLIQPLVKDPVAPGQIPDEELGDDPIQINTAWFSGGYINLGLGLYVLSDSETRHVLNLEAGLNETSDTLCLRLHHNAHGEYYGAPGIDTNQLVYAGSYVCFPTKGLLPEGMDSIPVKLIWRWHVILGGFISSDLAEFEELGVLK